MDPKTDVLAAAPHTQVSSTTIMATEPLGYYLFFAGIILAHPSVREALTITSDNTFRFLQ